VGQFSGDMPRYSGEERTHLTTGRKPKREYAHRLCGLTLVEMEGQANVFD
jgi:hypothetical protein